MMLIHISQERMAAIRSQQYGFKIEMKSVDVEKYRAFDIKANLIHELNGEHAFCEACGAEFDSIKASSPLEWDRIKESLKAFHRNLRVQIAAARALGLSNISVNVDGLEKLLDVTALRKDN